MEHELQGMTLCVQDHTAKEMTEWEMNRDLGSGAPAPASSSNLPPTRSASSASPYTESQS